MINIKRVYDKAETKGLSILVDRLWPRGVSKSSLNLTLWAKEIAPSNELRQEFNHEASRFNDFKEKYINELNSNPYAKSFKEQYQNQDITLLYSAKNTQCNNAVVLKEWLER